MAELKRHQLVHTTVVTLDRAHTIGQIQCQLAAELKQHHLVHGSGRAQNIHLHMQGSLQRVLPTRQLRPTTHSQLPVVLIQRQCSETPFTTTNDDADTHTASPTPTPPTSTPLPLPLPLPLSTPTPPLPPLPSTGQPQRHHNDTLTDLTSNADARHNIAAALTWLVVFKTPHLRPYCRTHATIVALNAGKTNHVAVPARSTCTSCPHI